MKSSVSKKAGNLGQIKRGLLFWEVVSSACLSLFITAGAVVYWYFVFFTAITTHVLITGLICAELFSFWVMFATVRWINRITGRKNVKRRHGNSAPDSVASSVAVPRPAAEVSDIDTEQNISVNGGLQYDNLAGHYSNYYNLIVNTFGSGETDPNLAAMAQSTSHTVQKINPASIKKCLLEKENRIVEIIDMNINETSSHHYDFSATIYVSAKSLIKAAEVVDSANTILAEEFNIKDTRLIPIISRC